MRKALYWIGGIIAVAALLFFTVLPPLFDRLSNRIEGSGEWPVSARAAALHKQLTVIDLHADSLLWKRDFTQPAGRGHVDLPRLEAGHVALQVLSSVTKTPRGQNYSSNSNTTDNITTLVIGQMQPLRTWTSLLERSLWHAEKLHRAEAASGGKLRIIRSQADLVRLLGDRLGGKAVPIGALLSVEGAHDLEGRIGNLDRLYGAGFRMIGLVHFFDNDVGGSMHGEKKYGLTPFGVQLVSAMEQKGMIVDVAHASAATVADVLRIATRPVVVSHGGVKGTCDTPRNLTDDQLRALAKNGGMIGIGYWDAAVCAPTPAATARAILYVRNLIGIQYVGLGSDYDGVVTAGFDTAHVAAITQALIDAGLSDSEIAMVMGGNAARIIGLGLVPHPAPPVLARPPLRAGV